MNVFEVLLSKRWILKDRDKDLYYKVKDQVGNVKRFFTEKLGYQVIITPNLIKLEKLPAVPSPWMGIDEFNEKIQYIFLCLILMFLEDKEAGEQFILSELTEYIQAKYEEEPIDWTLYQYRRHLVRSIKYCLNQGMIKIDDGTQESFMSDYEREVLYEDMGISRYFMRQFTQDILEYHNIADLVAGDWIDVDEDRGIIRRQRVYRKLLFSLGVYKEGEDDEDFAYIKNYRNLIAGELNEFIPCELHVHKTSAYLILGEEYRMGRAFPSQSTVSDIILLCNHMIYEQIKNQDIALGVDENAVVGEAFFRSIIERCKIKYGSGWIKTYREMTTGEFYKMVKEYMEYHGMIEVYGNRNEILLRPIFGKIIGYFPDDYVAKEKIDE